MENELIVVMRLLPCLFAEGKFDFNFFFGMMFAFSALRGFRFGQIIYMKEALWFFTPQVVEVNKHNIHTGDVSGGCKQNICLIKI